MWSSPDSPYLWDDTLKNDADKKSESEQEKDFKEYHDFKKEAWKTINKAFDTIKKLQQKNANLTQEIKEMQNYIDTILDEMADLKA